MRRAHDTRRADPGAHADAPDGSPRRRPRGGALPALARGELHFPPADTPIDLYVGRIHAGTLTGEQQPDALAEHPDETTVTTAPPTHPCLHAREQPPELSPYWTVVLTGGQTCVDYFAVELYVNDVGKVVAVGIVLTEP